MAADVAQISNILNDDEFIKSLSTEFTNDEQQLFMKNFKQYLQYGTDDKSFVINFDDVWEWVGFTQKNNAKRLLVKSFTKDIDYVVMKALIFEDQTTVNGGQNKEKIMLTVNTFKKFCLKADTKRADEVCNYYIKMENVLNKYITSKLLEMNNNILLLELKTKNDNEINNHKMLIDKYDKKKLVYVMKVKHVTPESFVIKIGKTRNIKERITTLNSEFKTQLIILNVFECEKYEEFEVYLHNHNRIKPLQYQDEDVKSRECFLLKHDEHYNMIKRIIERSIIAYKYESLDKLKDILGDTPDVLNKVLGKLGCNDEEIEEPKENEEMIKEIYGDTNYIRKPRKLCGPKVQVYDVNDLTKVLYLFDGILEATRQIEGASFSQIQKSSRNNVVYMNYRWKLIDRNDPNPNEVKELGESVIKNVRENDYIAMLDIDMLKIIKVFNKQIDAADYFSRTSGSMCNAIKHKTILCGYRWELWNNVEEDLKEEYLITNKLETRSRGSLRAKVQKLDPDTNNVIEEFYSISEATRKCAISAKTFKKYSADNSVYEGYKWKIC